ncbi:MAG: 2-phosphosulfolactate phosphatase [Balneolaceae bacterium]
MANLHSLDVFFSAHAFQESEVRGKTAVIIDVLRASSTIITALGNGAKGVIPVSDMAEASRISQSVDSDNLLLCGEKDGVKIEGYDLGNSPLEYTREMVADKTLVFNTTNGTKAISKSLAAKHLLIAGFLNLSAVVNRLKATEHDVVLVCAGWRGRLSLEDLLLAGNIVFELCDGTLPKNSTDGATVAFGLYEKYQHTTAEAIGRCNHAVRLKDITGDEDILFCTKRDTSAILPILKDGILTSSNGI